MPFAHHFGGAEFNAGAQGAQQTLNALIAEYDLVACDSTKDLLSRYTTKEIFNQLRQAVDGRNLMKLQQILGIFEHDFVKVKNQPEEYEEWRALIVEDIVNARREGDPIDKEFF